MRAYTQLQELLDLRWPPVAISFCDAPPAGCAYWRMAAEGGVFYSEAADHFGCMACDPDVVIVRGAGKQVMLVAEAAWAMIPAALETSRGALSLACIGKLPGAKLAEVAGRLATIVHANQELQKFHQGRLA